MATRLLAVSWLALLATQLAWHVLLPPPHGTRNFWLAVILVVPLLLPLRGILAGSIRSITWGGYLSMLYLVIGVTEAWANTPQRIPALQQVLVVVVYVAAAVAFSRRVPRKS